MPSDVDLPDSLRQLFLEQEGLAHRRQMIDAGLTRAELRWRVARHWRVVLPGVVSGFTGRLDPRQRLIAASLYAGPDAVLSSTTAARWHGLTLPSSTQIQLDVPARRHARTFGAIEVRRTRHPDPGAWARGPLTVASPGRAVADATRDSALPRDALALVLEALHRAVVTVEMLHAELDLHPHAGNRLLRHALEAAHSHAWSAPEHDLLGGIQRSRVLPEVWANPRLHTPDGVRLPTPDLWVDPVALAIQVHSRRFHESLADWEGTVMRDGVFAEHGVPVLAFTPRRIADDPGWAVARVEQAYLALGSRPRPPVVADPQGPFRAV